MCSIRRFFGICVFVVIFFTLPVFSQDFSGELECFRRLDRQVSGRAWKYGADSKIVVLPYIQYVDSFSPAVMKGYYVYTKGRATWHPFSKYFPEGSSHVTRIHVYDLDPPKALTIRYVNWPELEKKGQFHFEVRNVEKRAGDLWVESFGYDHPEVEAPARRAFQIELVRKLKAIQGLSQAKIMEFSKSKWRNSILACGGVRSGSVGKELVGAVRKVDQAFTQARTRIDAVLPAIEE